jgi:hypothetical protein
MKGNIEAAWGAPSNDKQDVEGKQDWMQQERPASHGLWTYVHPNCGNCKIIDIFMKDD